MTEHEYREPSGAALTGFEQALANYKVAIERMTPMIDGIRSPMRTVILAGSYHEACQYARSRRTVPGAWFYAFREQDLRGYQSDQLTLVRVGEWWLNPLVAGGPDPFFLRLFPSWQDSPIDSPTVTATQIQAARERLEPEPRIKLMPTRITAYEIQVARARPDVSHTLEAFRHVIDGSVYGNPPSGRDRRCCSACAYFMSGNPSICNAFHEPHPALVENQCADFRQT